MNVTVNDKEPPTTPPFFVCQKKWENKNKNKRICLFYFNEIVYNIIREDNILFKKFIYKF